MGILMFLFRLSENWIPVNIQFRTFSKMLSFHPVKNEILHILLLRIRKVFIYLFFHSQNWKLYPSSVYPLLGTVCGTILRISMASTFLVLFFHPFQNNSILNRYTSNEHKLCSQYIRIYWCAQHINNGGLELQSHTIARTLEITTIITSELHLQFIDAAKKSTGMNWKQQKKPRKKQFSIFKQKFSQAINNEFWFLVYSDSQKVELCVYASYLCKFKQLLNHHSPTTLYFRANDFLKSENFAIILAFFVVFA